MLVLEVVQEEEAVVPEVVVERVTSNDLDLQEVSLYQMICFP